MPYTFGAAAADDIQVNTNTTVGAAPRVGLVCGWWRPTTLTATRWLWAAGATNVAAFGVQIDTTTDELRFKSNNATVNGEWTTTGVDMVVDEWRFLAFMYATAATPVAVWRCWAGSIEQAPTAVTVTPAVAPAGAFTGTATVGIGNVTTDALAFQGDIADVSLMVTSAGVGLTTHPFTQTTAGQISGNEADRVYESLILPIWLGDTSVMFTRNTVGNFARFHYPLDWGARIAGNVSDSATLPGNPTINGATWSQQGALRPSPRPDMWPMRRR